MTHRKALIATTAGIALATTIALGAHASATSSLAGGRWQRVADMKEARGFHTLTLLPGDRVLAVGGYPGKSLDSAEIYDVASNTWRMTEPTVYQHVQHATVALADGLALVTGGKSAPTAAEVFNAGTGKWSAVASMAVGRYGHTATRLNDGRVLVVGGCDAGCNIRSTEIFDPASGSWSRGGNLNTGRGWHTANLLPDGTVLVTGGLNNGTHLDSAEIYDPGTGAWSRIAPMSQARMRHTAVLTQRGLMVMGGFRGNVRTEPSLRSVEIYDFQQHAWHKADSLLYARREHTAAVLPDGSVLAIGGESAESFYNVAERWNPADGHWSFVESLLSYWPAEFASVSLSDGRVLIAGGTLAEARVTSRNTEIFSR